MADVNPRNDTSKAQATGAVAEVSNERPARDAHPKRPNRLLNNRFMYAILAAVLLTLASSAIVGFNMSSRNVIPVNDTINRYFDTCVGEGFGTGTPVIQTSERGFPLSHYSSSKIPICDNLVELKREKVGTVDLGAMLANVLFWFVVSYAVMRKLRRTS